MDPLTQGLLGASFGQALFGRTLGRRALVWGALVGMAPDLDVAAHPVSPMAEWLWHRGPTHALWFGPVVGPGVGWLLWKWKGGRLRDWMGLAIVSLFTQPLLDAFTTYGMQFKPREDGDGISLQGDTEGPTENRRLLEQSGPQIAELLSCAAREGWDGTEQLISFDTTKLPDWVGEEWYVNFLRNLVEVARTSALLRLRDGGRIAPKDSLIPYGDNEDQCVATGDLAAGLKVVRSNLPPQDFLLAWYHNVRDWERLLGGAPASLPEAFSLDRLAECVAAAATLEKLQTILSGEPQAITWLSSLIQLIHRGSRIKLFDDLPLLPSQSGQLRKRSELMLDMGIDPSLKDIAARLAVDLRGRLLDSNASTALALACGVKASAT